MTEYTDKVRSDNLDNQRTIWICPPVSGVAKHLIVFLDAELYRDRVGAHAMARELIVKREIADSWIVFVSYESIEARWKECACYRPFADFVANELLDRLSGFFPEIELVANRVIVGLSYTGLAAAYIAHEYPNLFDVVICQSGSFWWNDCWLVDEFRRRIQRPRTRYYLDVGVREVQENVRHREDVLQGTSQIEGVRRFRDVLLERGTDVVYAEFDGGHDCLCWRGTLPNALRWAVPIASSEPTAADSRGL